MSFTIAFFVGPLFIAAPFQEEDPGAPLVAELESAPRPKPVEPDGYVFHAAPVALSESARSEDWPCFLGPRHDGRSIETELDLDWDAAGPPRVFEVETGTGYAAPIISDGILLFSHRIEDKVHLDAFESETGLRIWRYSVKTEYKSRYIGNSGPRSTAVVDGDRVLLHDLNGVLHCLDLATGREYWQRDINAEFNAPLGFFAIVSSPLVHEGRLIQILGGRGGPSVAAFDVESGRFLWGAGKEWLADCASPILAEVDGEMRLFAMTGGESRPATGGLLIVDPKDGALEFEMPFRSRTPESVNACCPLVVDERVFVTAAYNTGSAAAKLGEEGEWQEEWRNRRFGIQFVNPVAVDGLVYVIEGVSHRAGALAVVDPATGEVLSRTNLDWDEAERSVSVGEGSLLWTEQGFLCLGDSGHLLALETTPEGAKIRSRATLFNAQESWTPLVLSHGLLYACQNNPDRVTGAPPRLICYDLRMPAGE